jgi:hypothetical protein
LLPRGADVSAVAKRTCALELLLYAVKEFAEKSPEPNPLAPLIHHQQPDDAMYAVMARIPLEKMEEHGCIYEGWPYDLEIFMRQVE